MPATPPPGSDLPPTTAPPPATLMGEGWRPRARTHAEEAAAGSLWGSFGVHDEISPLRRVLLTWPGDELGYDGDPNDMLMLARPDLPAMRREAEGIAAAFAALGAETAWVRPGRRAPPNLVFARDLVFLTPEGAVVARMAAEQRAGEERFVTEALAAAGVPILATPRGDATFEGADALWLDASTVIVGVGRRTNEAGFRTVGRVLADQGVRCVGVDLPAEVQHLQGSLTFVDRDLALTYAATPSLRAVLAEAGVREIAFADTAEITETRAMNLVTVAPRVVLMPANNPKSRARLEGEGIQVHEVVVDQYLRAAGGLGCLTGILRRDGSRSPAA